MEGVEELGKGREKSLGHGQQCSDCGRGVGVGEEEEKGEVEEGIGQ